MTVGDLIDVLMEFNPDLPVRVFAAGWPEYVAVTGVQVMRDTPLDPEWLVLTSEPDR